jgi:hypothetical protein
MIKWKTKNTSQEQHSQEQHSQEQFQNPVEKSHKETTLLNYGLPFLFPRL